MSFLRRVSAWLLKNPIDLDADEVSVEFNSEGDTVRPTGYRPTANGMEKNLDTGEVRYRETERMSDWLRDNDY